LVGDPEAETVQALRPVIGKVIELRWPTHPIRGLYNDNAVGVGEDAALVVDGLAGVSPSILIPDLPDGEHPSAVVTGGAHPRGVTDVAPVQAPNDERGWYPDGLALTGHSLSEFSHPLVHWGPDDRWGSAANLITAILAVYLPIALIGSWDALVTRHTLVLVPLTGGVGVRGGAVLFIA
jgi:hypothetical protein